MILFTDLDGTLIYSHRRTGGREDMICVEHLNGKEQSYMTRGAYDTFCKERLCDVIPVTTRTIAQYSRLLDALTLSDSGDALVCNGAMLLHGSTEDMEWRKGSEALCAEDTPFLYKAYEDMKSYTDDEIIFEEPFMFYVRSSDPSAAYNYASTLADDHIRVYADARKVYFIPASLDKSAAVKRYISLTGETAYICAGDSTFDIDMLRSSGLSFASPAIADKVGDNAVICGDIMTDRMTEMLRSIHIFGGSSAKDQLSIDTEGSYRWTISR
ncbi:MAG: hypothetical protein IKR73_05910 [Oscillospiraceae bacterium]|nr:hypothetical protein [Oscillospiraceae bacterium]